MTTTHYHTQPGLRQANRTGRSSAIAPVVRTLVAKFQSAFTLWNNRRAIYRLARLDDRYLEDIGVSRGDIDWALSQPWHVDPSILLNECVEKRRTAARWARQFHSF